MDYRQSSCSSGSNGILFFGGCYQHKKDSDIVVTWHPTLSPTPVPRNGDRNGGGFCDCTVEWTTTASGSNWNSCLWQNNAADLVAIQTFQSGSNLDLGNCFNIGFKNVAAKRQWHGRFSFLSNDTCPQDRSIAPDQTKYLSATLNSVFSTTEFDAVNTNPAVTDNQTFTQTSTIDASTGINTLNQSGTREEMSGTESLARTPDIPFIGAVDASACGITITTRLGTFSGADISDLIDNMNTAMPTYGDPDPYWSATGGTRTGQKLTISSASLSDTVFDIEFHLISVGVTGYFEGTQYLSLILSGENEAPDIMADTEGLLAQWDLTNNSFYPWRHDNYVTFMPLVARREVQSNQTPFTSIMSAWMDDYTNPILSGSGTSSVITGYNTRSWQDPNDYCWKWKAGYEGSWADSLESSHMDGSIIGKPLVSGSNGIVNSGSKLGIGWGWFDFYYTDIRYCPMPADAPTCFGVPWEQYTYRYGGTLADADISVSGIEDGGQMANILPMCATHWVNNPQAHSISRGAMQACGIMDDGIWSIKWAETRPPTRSQNFFRPCGSDRVLIDETTAKNFTEASSLIMEGELTGLSGGSTILVHNGSDNGIYTGCSQSDNGDGTWTLALGTKQADLPTDYSRPIDANCVGFVRFPNAWPICGREQIAVTSSVSGSLTGSKVSFFNAQTNLRTGDKITLYSRTTTTLTSASVSRLDDSNFFINTPFSGSLTSSIYAMAYGAPDYHWFDEGQKYEFRYGYWETSNRSSSFSNSSSCQSDCLPFTPCAEQVVCFSPNSESFANGKTYWFATGSFVADGVFGSYAQANVEFQMTDLLWQTPLRPIVGSLTDDPVTAVIRAEDGTCPEDSYTDTGIPILYYQEPRVEALCSVPSGSPALPSGITIPDLTQPPLAGLIGYSFHVYNQPTTYFYNAMQHCEDCRFEYYGC